MTLSPSRTDSASLTVLEYARGKFLGAAFAAASWILGVARYHVGGGSRIHRWDCLVLEDDDEDNAGEIRFRFVRPSATMIDGYVPPDRNVRGLVLSTDAHHLVIPPAETRRGMGVTAPLDNNDCDDDRPPPPVLRVFLPGTAGRPRDASCLLRSIAAVAVHVNDSSPAPAPARPPVIGLSYAFFGATDRARNRLCRERHLVRQRPDEVDGGVAGRGRDMVRHRSDGVDEGAVDRQDLRSLANNSRDGYLACLENQHRDALWGRGTSFPRGPPLPPQLWPAVDWRDSIEGRLVRLLQYLAVRYPHEGWRSYLKRRQPIEKDDEEDGLPSASPGAAKMTTVSASESIDWGRLWVLGHSQGAGHAAYLAKRVSLAGAGLLSGPQDDCRAGASAEGEGGRGEGELACWAAGRFATTTVRAMAHAHERDIHIIRDNWKSMQFSSPSEEEPVVLDDASKAGAVTEDGGPSLFKDVSRIVTSLEPVPFAGCTLSGAQEHCSTTMDRNAPLLPLGGKLNIIAGNGNQSNPYLYAAAVWPHLAGLP